MAIDKQKLFLLGGLLAGLALRFLMLFSKGTDDMYQYFDWGNATLRDGLASAFHGNIFLIQYQLFSFCSWIIHITHIDFFIIFKAMNLSFDIGNFVLLTTLLQENEMQSAV